MTNPPTTPASRPSLVPSLICRGADDAIAFYARAFGAELRGRMPPEPGGKVMHAHLQFGDAAVYLSDETPEQGMGSPLHYGGSPVGLVLSVSDCDAAFARATAAGARALVPPCDAFWGDRWAMLADPFGHVWQLATPQELTPEERARRMASAGPCGGAGPA